MPSLDSGSQWERWFAWRPVRIWTWLPGSSYIVFWKSIWRRPSDDPNRLWEYRD